MCHTNLNLFYMYRLNILFASPDIFPPSSPCPIFGLDCRPSSHTHTQTCFFCPPASGWRWSLGERGRNLKNQNEFGLEYLFFVLSSLLGSIPLLKTTVPSKNFSFICIWKFLNLFSSAPLLICIHFESICWDLELEIRYLPLSS